MGVTLLPGKGESGVNSISKNVKVDIPIVGDAKNVLSAMIDMLTSKPFTIDHGAKEKWMKQIDEWKQKRAIPQCPSDKLSAVKVIETIYEYTKPFHPIVCTEVGQHQMWCAQMFKFDEPRRFITSGGLGTMGYGFPAAIGAKIGNPQKNVIVISGDGGMQMNIQEMATAVVYELPIIICILNNGYLGNVRQWQEMFYNKRYSSTCMRYRKSCEIGCNQPKHDCPEYSPDFISLAESYGAKGIRVTKSEEINSAFEFAKQNTKAPTVIEFIIDREKNVLPIVPPGNALIDMVLESEGEVK